MVGAEEGGEDTIRVAGQQGSRVRCVTFPMGPQEVLTMSVPLKLPNRLCAVCLLPSKGFFFLAQVAQT